SPAALRCMRAGISSERSSRSRSGMRYLGKFAGGAIATPPFPVTRRGQETVSSEKFASHVGALHRRPSLGHTADIEGNLDGRAEMNGAPWEARVPITAD